MVVTLPNLLWKYPNKKTPSPLDTLWSDSRDFLEVGKQIGDFHRGKLQIRTFQIYTLTIFSPQVRIWGFKPVHDQGRQNQDFEDQE